MVSRCFLLQSNRFSRAVLGILTRGTLAELHSEIRRSLQKFELLSKALSKANQVKGAPKIVNLGEEQSTEAKSVKLPKLAPAFHAMQSGQYSDSSAKPNDPDLFNQLTLLDHLLRLPAEQLQTSSQRDMTVSLADLNQPIAMTKRNGSSGVSLFSSAAAISAQADSLSAPHMQKDAEGSPSRHVHFAAAGVPVGSERCPAIPGAENACAAQDARRAPVSKIAPSTVSPRTRAIKNTATASGADSNSASAKVHAPSSAAAPGGAGKANLGCRIVGEVNTNVAMKAIYGSVGFGEKRKLNPLPSAIEGNNRS